MTPLPDPVWPVVVLAVIQLFDALICIKPVSFIGQCFEKVGWPRRFWWLMPPIKFAPAAGLIAGLWIPYLGLVTCGALTLYFLIAITMHVRARDVGRDLFVNAVGMLLVSVATGVFSFLL